MLDPRALYTVNADVWDSVAGQRPVLVHLLEGYIDAGQVARQLADHIRENLTVETMVTFDHDQLHDFRSRRPVMVFDTNHYAQMTDVALVIDKVTDASGRSFLLLSGPEPDSQWNRAAAAILGIARELDCSLLLTAQGVPMGVPHTRPILLTEHANDPSLLGENPVWIDRVSVPGSFSSVLEYKAEARGLLARGIVAHVPHYLASGTYAPAALRILDRVRELTGFDIPPAGLATLSLQTLSALEEEAANDGELAPLVDKLEEQYDQMLAGGRAQVPSADEIGAAVEQFLAEHDEEGPDGTH